MRESTFEGVIEDGSFFLGETELVEESGDVPVLREEEEREEGDAELMQG